MRRPIELMHRLVIGATLVLVYGGNGVAQRTSLPTASSAPVQMMSPKNIYCPPKQDRGTICSKRKLRVARKLGCTPLMRAAESGNQDQVRALLKRGADVNAALPQWGITALMLAAGEGHLQIVNALLVAGADPNAVASGHGGVPAWAWMFAMNRCNKNWLEIADAVLAAGVEINPTAIYESPLAYAIKRDDTVMIEALLKRGADVNLMDQRDGETPLMFAARYSTPKVVKALIDAGADLTAKNKEGKTALVIAEEDKDNLWRDEIVMFLRQVMLQRWFF
jgi:ankyrin repeat protein